MNVGSATVEVNADLQKLLEGLNKAKAASDVFISNAAKTFVALGAGATAAGVAVAGVGTKLAPVNAGLVAMGQNTKTVTAGLTAMLGVLGKVAVSALAFTARHPVMGTALTTMLLGGSPTLAAATLAVGTERGRSTLGTIGRGLATAGGFAMRHPLTALGLGAAGGFLGMAAIGAAAAAGSAGFDALRNSFNEARESSQKLQADLNSLKEAAEKLTQELPKGSDSFNARSRRLGGVTGGLTSDFALLAGGTGEVNPDVIARSSTALEELTLRMGDQRRAAEMLALALRDPAHAWQRLAEAGIVFTAQQRRQLEGMVLFEDRLRSASRILDIIVSQQGPQVKRSGFIQLMEAIGKFAGSAPGAVSSALTGFFKDIANELARVSGLTYVLAELDRWLGSIGQKMSALNRRFFPADAQQELANVQSQLASIDAQLEQLSRRGVSSLPLIGNIQTELQRLERLGLETLRGPLAERRDALVWEQFYTMLRSIEEQQRRLNDRAQTRLQTLREELRLMQANNRAQLQANQIAAELGLPRDDPRVQQMVQLLNQIERRRRAIAQAGQLSVFERENQQLQQQVQLFRFGNEEMEARNRLLQIELQAARQRRPLTDAQKNELLERITLLKEVQRLTGTINQAAEAVFSALGDAVAQFAITGKFKFKEFADSVVQQLVRIAMQAFVIRPLLNAISGFTNPLIANMVSPGSTTGPISIPRAGGFAKGGSFSVPGGGNGDKPYLIGLSAGERVDVTPQGQVRNGGGGSVTVNNTINSSKDMEVTTRTRQGADGRTIIDQTFNEVVKRIGRGDADDTFGARYGMRPRTLQR